MSAQDPAAACQTYRERVHPIPGATCPAFLQGFPLAVPEVSRRSPFVQRPLVSEKTEQRRSNGSYDLPHDESLDVLIARVGDLPDQAHAPVAAGKLLGSFYRCDREQ